MAKIPGTKYVQSGPKSEMHHGEMRVFSGSTSAKLGEDIVAHIRRSGQIYDSLALGKVERSVFSNENIFIRLNESVRGKDVYLIQTMSSPVNEVFMEILIMIDALKRDSAWRINLVVPYMSYTRSDKKDQPRVPITARLVANMIETAGADRYITIDLHSGQIQGFFNIPGDSLTALYLLADYVKDKNIDDLVVVATDLGFAKQGRNYAEHIGVPLAFVEKRRTSNEENAEALSLIGDVKGKNVLLVDDEVNTAGTIVQAVKVVRDHGAKDVFLAFTHPFLADVAYDRLKNLNLNEIICTDTIQVPDDKKIANMTILSVAPMLAEVMLRAHEGRSVGELFDE